MASLIGQLKVTLGLETAAFESGATRAAKRTDQLGDGMERLGFRIGSMGKALAVAATAVVGSALFSTLKDLTMQGLQYASGLEEQAQQLGILASEMQEFRYAASQTGVAQEEMDRALQKLTRTIGEAGHGSGKGAKAFRELGIDVRDASGNLKSAGVIFPEVARALESIPNPADRARLQVELFGKAGQQLNPLLNEGAGGIAKLREEARSLGIVLSDEQIANADKTADKIDALKQALNARIAAVVAENAKEIGELAEALAKLAEAAIKALAAWVRWQNGASSISREVIKADAYLEGRKDLTPKQRTAAKAGARKIIEDRNGFESSPYGGYLGKLIGLRVMKPKNANLGGDRSGPFDFDPGLIKGGLDVIGGEIEDVSTAAEDMKMTFEQAANGVVNALDRMAGAFRGGGFLEKLSAVIGLGIQLGGAGVFGSKIQANINKPLPTRAFGGPVLAGRMHLVGERGPELFVPESSGSIKPAGTFGGGAGIVKNYFQGNLMTPEFWAMIEAGNRQAAQAGALGGEARVLYRNRRRLA